jgi:pyruvate/2-oxoacid:ferredoxin oxidoreductase alpha subunit
MDADMKEALEVIAEVGAQFGRRFGRSYGLVDPYRCEDADAILVTSGAVGSTAIAAVDALRKKGLAAGNLRIRSFRPFPVEALTPYARTGVPLVVVDRNYSPGASGIFFQELKAALFPLPSRPPVYGYVAGLGGGDITSELLQEIWNDALSGPSAALETAWMEEAR